MQRSDGLSRAPATVARRADDRAGEWPGTPPATVRVASGTASCDDAVEAALRRRARRMGLWLMAASSVLVVAVILAAALLLR